MYKSFFAARDALDMELASGVLVLPGPQNAVFRYLLEHALYRPHNPAEYGLVLESAVGNGHMARMTGLHANTVQRAVTALNASGLVKSWGRPVFAGGKQADMIEILWLTSEYTAEVSSVHTAEVSSSSFVEEGMEEVARA